MLLSDIKSSPLTVEHVGYHSGSLQPCQRGCWHWQRQIHAAVIIVFLTDFAPCCIDSRYSPPVTRFSGFWVTGLCTGARARYNGTRRHGGRTRRRTPMFPRPSNVEWAWRYHQRWQQRNNLQKGWRRWLMLWRSKVLLILSENDPSRARRPASLKNKDRETDRRLCTTVTSVDEQYKAIGNPLFACAPLDISSGTVVCSSREVCHLVVDSVWRCDGFLCCRLWPWGTQRGVSHLNDKDSLAYSPLRWYDEDCMWI